MLGLPLPTGTARWGCGLSRSEAADESSLGLFLPVTLPSINTFFFLKWRRKGTARGCEQLGERLRTQVSFVKDGGQLWEGSFQVISTSFVFL